MRCSRNKIIGYLMILFGLSVFVALVFPPQIIVFVLTIVLIVAGIIICI